MKTEEHTHPTYYETLLRRRFTADPALTLAERREMDSHLLICPRCNYDYVQMLMPREPETAGSLLRSLEGALTADLVVPYLRDLARATQAEQTLTGFQRIVWRFLCRDREAMGRFRLVEADTGLSSGGLGKVG
jgi:hypothetical protein